MTSQTAEPEEVEPVAEPEQEPEPAPTAQRQPGESVDPIVITPGAPAIADGSVAPIMVPPTPADA